MIIALKRVIHTPAWCAKISAALKGKKKSPEHAAKCRTFNLGKHHTEATKRHLSRVMMGRFVSSETKEKQRYAALKRKRCA